ncbi:MAG: SagB/ThcOx family dehydrogenase [Nitrospirae bacterium]|nr:SagB/ThcOx family dehydrogenase [Nitrospirota bacterium]
MEKNKALAIAYHDATKHSFLSVRSGDLPLDWEIKPSEYKIYKGCPKTDLGKEMVFPDLAALEAVKKGGYGGTRSVMSIPILAGILHLSYGHTAKKVYPGTTYYLRSSPSAGALYPVEVYLHINGIDGIADGLYHYTPCDSSIYLLRGGDFREIISEATGGDRAILSADLTIILSTIFWRSAWKYKERAYRYCLLDTGHLAGNILAAGSSFDMGPSVIESFVDSDINHLLGIDGEREAAQLIIAFETGKSYIPSLNKVGICDLPKIKDPLGYQGEAALSLINKLHSASSYKDRGEFMKFAGKETLSDDDEEEDKIGDISRLAIPDKVSMPNAKIGDIILRRRSSRDFQKTNIPFAALSLILHYSFQGYRSDITEGGSMLLDTYIVINGVDGMRPGLYCFNRDEGCIAKIKIRGVKDRDLRDEVTYLCLEQRLCGNASAVFFFTADLKNMISRYGERIYRSIHLEAGILGENIYLSAKAIGIGATGIGAFYDDDAADFLTISRTGGKVIYVMAIGIQSNDK